MKTNSRSPWRKLASLMLALAALVLLQSSVVLAQTQEPAKPTSEVEQLKQRLQQLEQTVSDLKGQITGIEEKKKIPAPAIVEATYSVPATPADPEPPAKPQDQNGKGESTFTVYRTLQLYAGASRINGQFGDPWDFRSGVNWFPWQNKVVRWNTEWLYLRNSPVGYSSVPFVVGARGNVFHSSLELAF